MEVWDLKEGQVIKYEGTSSLLISCFDPEKSLYLYEPGESRKGPYFSGLEIPTMCSVSPDKERYKEFEKNRAVKLYVPPWTLPELLAVGEFVLRRSPNQMPLTAKEISERFHKFGGIFRHVFAPNIGKIEEEQRRAIQDLDPKDFFRGRKGVSHCVAQYVVITEGPDAYENASIDFLCDYVREAAEGSFTKLALSDKILMLRENDRCPTLMASKCELTYEEVVLQRLRQGVDWQKKNFNDPLYSDFNLKLKKIVLGKPPMFTDMEPDVLYKSFKSTYPAVDMMYRTSEGFLYGLQITREKNRKEIATSAVDKWLNSIGWTDNMEKVRIAVIPKPDLAEELKVVYVGDGTGYPQLEMWKVPSDYGR